MFRVRTPVSPHIMRFLAEYLFAPDDIEREIARSPHDPVGGIFRHAVKRAGPQRQRLLHHVLGQREVFQAEDAGQGRYHLARLVAKKVLYHPWARPWMVELFPRAASQPKE